MVCELSFLHDTKEFHLAPLGMNELSRTVAKDKYHNTPLNHNPLDVAVSAAGISPDAALLSCDVLTLSEERSALIMIYQDLLGTCWLLLVPFSMKTHNALRERSSEYDHERMEEKEVAAPPPHPSDVKRFEQSAVPLKAVPLKVSNEGETLLFHGVLLFRHDSIVAYGYLMDRTTALSTEETFLLSPPVRYIQ
jgi:hypothetical protein